MRNVSAGEIQVGCWATLCCHCDLAEIATEEKRLEVIEDNNDGLPWRAWKSEAEALLDISEEWESGSLERASCVARIQKLRK
jgi:hypothetical protein